MKCGIEYGDETLCQNHELVGLPEKMMDDAELSRRYLENNITEAIVIGGLEPFDKTDNVMKFIACLRHYTDDDIVIYTGFNEHEVVEEIEQLKKFHNIIVKFGRYIPNHEPHMDKVLGVKLASDNQYAKKIS